MPEPAALGGGSLVIASNRLPFDYERGPRGLTRRASSGGLVSALDPALRKRGGCWVGWPGSGVRPGDDLEAPEDPYRVIPIHLDAEEVERYYRDFSNRCLWPLFHSLPGRAAFDTDSWNVYRRVNARFAEALLCEVNDRPLLWVHDYHLMLVPELVRSARPQRTSVFFLHVPFPSYDLFTLLPRHEDLLRGVLGSHLVGFQTRACVKNFLECAERCLDAAVDRERQRVTFEGRSIRVGAFPIGIDYSRFEAYALNAPPRVERRQRVILGADRLDYTKGISQRIQAMERLLALHPEHLEHVTLVQIAVPSRCQVAEYQDLKCEIDELVGRVNGRFASASWSPIQYLYRSIDHDQLAGLYRDADVALVTPLRDGMNLVAKEFVACQVDDPGVLVLSRFAGAADAMAEALLVNPYDLDGTAEALHQALCMDESERQRRMTALRVREAEHDVHAWVDALLRSAAESRRG
jgi:trehalose 6-phosphate synthase/phosphatase